MSVQRIDRVNEILKREIASGLYHLKADAPLDLARITVSSVMCAPDLRKARVLVSVLHDSPEAPEVHEIVRVLNRHRRELQAMIAKNVILKFTPHLQFIADDSLDDASRILRILDALPPPAPEDAPDGSEQP